MLSIIVVAYNRPKLTLQTLTSLHDSLKDTSIPHEVIVVDNQSDAPTQQIINRFATNFSVHRIEQNKGCAAGKNHGIALAAGDTFYLSDNDMFFMPGWAETLLRAQRVFERFSILGGFRHPYHGVLKRHAHSGLVVEESDQQVGSSWLLSRETWEAYGPLNETVETGKDDVLFCNAITADGFAVGAIHPNLVIHCGATDTTGQSSPGADRWAHDPVYYDRLPKGTLIQ